MSLFGSLLGDMENDPIFGSHMRTMRHMNSVMSSLFGDPFDYLGMPEYGPPALAHARAASHNSLLPFHTGFPVMPNYMPNNRLLSGSLDSLGGDNHCYSSSTVVSMTSGPDGRPHVYKATASTRSAPGGVRETQRTMSDSRTGTKKMAIGHHIGERAHIIEREQNVHSGDQEERQDFINLEEEQAEDFNREWETKSRSRSEIPRITAGGSSRSILAHGDGLTYGGHSTIPAITAGPSSRRHRERHIVSTPGALPRRSIRSSSHHLTTGSPSISTSARSPYSPPGITQPRKNKNIKTVSGSPPSPDM